MIIFPTKNNGLTLELLVLRPENYETIKKNLNNQFKAQPNTEYGRIVKSINYILFNAGRNFNEIYDKFFKEEYGSFYDYLEQEEGFNEKFIEELKNYTTPNDNLWEVRISDCEGYNFSNLFDCFIWENNDLIEILNKALKECNNEN